MRGGDSKIISMDNTFKSAILEELREKEIDISKDDYYQKPAFKELEQELVMDGGVTMTKAWWIEKNIVGQERMTKIYGIYALGIKHVFLKSELKDNVWFKELADKYPELVRTETDIYRYFYRKEVSKDGTERLGLIYRLKKQGFNIEQFAVSGASVKLLYFLYCFEVEHKLELTPFLRNPTLENVDNRIVGDITKNGDLVGKIKRNIAKEIEPRYLMSLNDSVVRIASQWKKGMEKVRLILDASDNGQYIQELNRIYEYVQIVLSQIGDKQYVKYKDSVLETFYLMLVQHECLGREMDIVDVAAHVIQIQDIDDRIDYCPDEYKKLAYIVVKENEERIAITDYIKTNRKKLAQFVFGQDRISSNEYKKFDAAASKIKFYLEMLQDNSAFKLNEEGIPVLLIIVCLQEIIIIDKNLKIENSFYRHESGDLKTLNAELPRGISAFRKNQIAWIERVNYKFNVYAGRKEETIFVKKIEASMDILFTKIFQSDSLEDMMCLHEYLNMMVYIAFFEDRKMKEGLKYFSNAISRRKKGYQIVGNPFTIRRFIAVLMPGTVLERLAKQISKSVMDAEKREAKIKKQWPVELGKGNYFRDMVVKVLINPFDKTIEIDWFGFEQNHEAEEILQNNGIKTE